MALKWLRQTLRKKPTTSIQPSSSAGEARILEIGRTLLDSARRHESGFLSGKFYSDKLISFAMKDERFKAQLFRFVDVFPVLRSSEAIYQHLAEYLLREDVKLPPGFEWGLKAAGIARASSRAAVLRASASKCRSVSGFDDLPNPIWSGATTR